MRRQSSGPQFRRDWFQGKDELPATALPQEPLRPLGFLFILQRRKPGREAKFRK